MSDAVALESGLNEKAEEFKQAGAEINTKAYHYERQLERYLLHMATIVEIEKLALSLPEQERAALAANLLDSLPGVLFDEDEGVAEALRRDSEMDANPDQIISPAQLDAQIQSRRS